MWGKSKPDPVVHLRTCMCMMSSHMHVRIRNRAQTYAHKQQCQPCCTQAHRWGRCNLYTSAGDAMAYSNDDVDAPRLQGCFLGLNTSHHVRVWLLCLQAIKLLGREFLLNCEKIFESGTLLGSGSEGEVRRVEIRGAAYALKHEAQESSELVWARRLQHCKGVQTVLLSRLAADGSAYCLFPLAAGSFEDAMMGISVTFGCGQQQHEHARLQQARQQQSDQQTVGGCDEGENREGGSLALTCGKAASWLANKLPRHLKRLLQQDSSTPVALRLPVDWVQPLAAQLSAPVAEMHEAETRHGDIKEQNYFIGLADGGLVIGDLGLTEDAVDVMDGGGVGGSPFYMAPEMLPPQSLWGIIKQHALVWWQNIFGEFGPVLTNNTPSDVWAYGMMLVRVALPPEALEAAYHDIHKGCWQPPACLPADLASLLKAIFALDPMQRPTMQQVQAHEFFRGVDWGAVRARRAVLPVDLIAMAEVGKAIAARDAVAVAGSREVKTAGHADGRGTPVAGNKMRRWWKRVVHFLRPGKAPLACMVV